MSAWTNGRFNPRASQESLHCQPQATDLADLLPENRTKVSMILAEKRGEACPEESKGFPLVHSPGSDDIRAADQVYGPDVVS